MPRIFDNIEQQLSPALIDALKVSYRADFCVGYFNLRGWKRLAREIDNWPGGEGHSVRLLVGMHSTPQDDVQSELSLNADADEMDNPKAVRIRRRLAEEFRRQLMLGVPSDADEEGLRTLARQLREKKLVVRLFLKHKLHAKLYLVFREDRFNPRIGFLGSSNLTLSGLRYQGELNVDVLEDDACKKLEQWFEERWNENFCLDISEELANIIEESWARPELLSPYDVYLKMAYHLAQEAREGLLEFVLPSQFRNKLFDFQAAAVKIAARHLNRRNGVIIGDVVGLGKTLMATALASIFEEALGVSTLIICPPKLMKMWQGYVDTYGLRGKVMSSGAVQQDLRDVPARFRLVVLDESHNFRNREGARYRAIKEYIDTTDSRCILLTATPYNKSYLDLSAQLRLFVDADKDLGVRPEAMLREVGDVEFSRYQVSPTTLAAFEKSAFADDWRELMRLFLVRRTRTFIKAHYALTDERGHKYLLTSDGKTLPFPNRLPKTLKYALDAKDKDDQYARLYSEPVVNAIGALSLPRYGLAQYLLADSKAKARASEKTPLDNLSKAGKRLIGYCRINLFKRLESSGYAFALSLDRHILRNYVYLYALEHDFPLPIGTQSAELLDPGNADVDADLFEDDSSEAVGGTNGAGAANEYTAAAYRQRAKAIYEQYVERYEHKFGWLRSALFTPLLRQALETDSAALMKILRDNGAWDAARDRKLAQLEKLVKTKHPNEKVLIFTQFADTVEYVADELARRGVKALEGVTASSADPTGSAWRFSPRSNEKEKEYPPGQQLRVLVATDVLSEGQNLQDSHIVVNYDLPWAIIRLVQRAGRVDRIGQTEERILCYSFLPADGVEQIIRLRSRVLERLQQNAEVIGTDEEFFEGDAQATGLRDLYTERAGALDDEGEGEVDLASYAYQIWHDATKDDPALAKRIGELPNVVYATRAHEATPEQPEGVLVYMRTGDDYDALVYMDRQKQSVTQSQLRILQTAACAPDTPPQPRNRAHHGLVEAAVKLVGEQQAQAETSGALGRPSGARHRAYVRLKGHFDFLRETAPLMIPDGLEKAVNDLLRWPLRETAKDILNRQLKAGIGDDALSRLVMELREETRLSVIPEEGELVRSEPQIICSMGLFEP